MSEVRCQHCGAVITDWHPSNIGNPANPSERRLVIWFECCGDRQRADAVFTVATTESWLRFPRRGIKPPWLVGEEGPAL